MNRTLPGHPEIFVCGDLAHVEEAGRQIPGVAQPAMQMGRHAAQMIGQDLAGKPRTRFHYFDKGDMATIGDLIINISADIASFRSSMESGISQLVAQHSKPLLRGTQIPSPREC